jgi:hypothetical protein
MTSKTTTSTQDNNMMYSQLSANLSRSNNNDIRRLHYQQQRIEALPTSLVASSLPLPYLPIAEPPKRGDIQGLLDIIDQALAIVEGTDYNVEDTFLIQ